MVNERLQQMFLTSPRSVNASPASGSAMTISGHLGNAQWIFDSGASYHMTHYSTLLFGCFKPCTQLTIYTADGSPMSVQTIGSLN